MKSLEMKPEPSMDMEAMAASSFPSFYVCDEQMPEISGWETNGEYTLMVKVSVKSKSQTSTIDGVDTDACLSVLSYEVQK